MERKMELIYEMLENIRTCPHNKCAACVESVELAEKMLNQVRAKVLKMEDVTKNTGVENESKNAQTRA